MSNLKSFLGGLDSDTWTDAKAGYLDDNISTKAPASTALSTSTWTNTRAENLDDLDTTISSRAPSSTALSTSVWTNTRAGYLDNLAGGVGGGYRPVASYGYSGTFSASGTSSGTQSISVSIANYQNCLAVGTSATPAMNASLRGACTYRPINNSTVRVHYYQSATDVLGYAIAVYRWG